MRSRHGCRESQDASPKQKQNQEESKCPLPKQPLRALAAACSPCSAPATKRPGRLSGREEQAGAAVIHKPWSFFISDKNSGIPPIPRGNELRGRANYLQELQHRPRPCTGARGAACCQVRSPWGRGGGQWQRAMVSMLRKRTCILVSMSIPCQIWKGRSSVAGRHTGQPKSPHLPLPPPAGGVPATWGNPGGSELIEGGTSTCLRTGCCGSALWILWEVSCR